MDPIVGVVLPFLNEIVALYATSVATVPQFLLGPLVLYRGFA